MQLRVTRSRSAAISLEAAQKQSATEQHVIEECLVTPTRKERFVINSVGISPIASRRLMEENDDEEKRPLETYIKQKYHEAHEEETKLIIRINEYARSYERSLSTFPVDLTSITHIVYMFFTVRCTLKEILKHLSILQKIASRSHYKLSEKDVNICQQSLSLSSKHLKTIFDTIPNEILLIPDEAMIILNPFPISLSVLDDNTIY